MEHNQVVHSQSYLQLNFGYNMGTILNIWIEHVDLEGCKHECKSVFECLGEYSRK